MFDPSLLWYLGRGSGLVAEVLLTLVVVMGAVSSAPGGSGSVRRRVLLQGLHRQLPLAGVVVLVVHIGTLVLDTYVDLDLVDVVLPFGSTYRTVWLGLGTLALDLAAVVVVTSLLRSHLGPRSWRATHLLAYVAWAMAMAHGLMSGSDVGSLPVRWLAAGCVGAVGMALTYRVESARSANRRAPVGERLAVRS